MPTLESQRAKRAAVLEEIVDARLRYPSEEHSNWETYINFPDVKLGVELKSGGWIYPDVVVAQEPGHFIQALAVVALRHEVTEEEARERWAPLSKAGSLYLYVPAGYSARANRLCREFGARPEGIRTWRRTAQYGTEVNDAYSGPDVFAAIARFLPPALRPSGYRPERRRVVESYRSPLMGQQRLTAPAEQPALPAPADSTPTDAMPAAPEHVLPEGVHLPPPSLSPALLAIGAILSGLGVIFPGETLGAGAMLLLLGALSWLGEDVVAFVKGDHDAEPAPAAPVYQPPPGVHMPPPSLSPAMLALGAILAGLGFIFPAELLGAGGALIVVAALRWLGEDIRDFRGGAHAETSHDEEAVEQHA